MKDSVPFCCCPLPPVLKPWHPTSKRRPARSSPAPKPFRR
jgi:hypothetical protein